MKLKPIESAPKGVNLILYGYLTCHYKECCPREDKKSFFIGTVVSENEHTTNVQHYKTRPTHWCELPEVPNE